MHLYNSHGQLVTEKKLHQMNETLNMSSLASGNYIIAFSNDEEKIVYKVTKE